MNARNLLPAAGLMTVFLSIGGVSLAAPWSPGHPGHPAPAPFHPVHPVLPVHPVHYAHPMHHGRPLGVEALVETPVFVPPVANPPVAAPYTTTICIVNPVTTGVTVGYELDGVSFSLGPGMVQELGTVCVIEFDRGYGLGLAQYTLYGGAYSFFVADDGGWDLFRSPLY
ncbi:MAG: hypothetical protein ACLQNE_33785 [Thermoguttaceae bacterium]